MNLIGDAKVLKDRAFVLGLFTVFFLISPGIACIYLYFPAYIVELDAVKLILLSITCTMPLAVINAFTIGLCDRRTKEKNEDLFYDFVAGTIFAGILLYVAVIGSFLANLPPRELGLVVAVVELLFIGAVWVESRTRGR